jgi:PucR family transcriptional regulator, purine catabolism regulatory protein
VTGVPLRGMLAHPRWSDVHELTGLATDPWLARAEVVRDLRTVRAATPQTLLVVLYSEDRNDWRLDALLSRSAQEGVGAVVLEGTAPLQSSTLALARRLSLPVLATPDPLAAHQAFQRLSEEGDLERAALTLRAVGRAARAGPEVADVLRLVRRAVGRPVALLDSHGTHVAGDPHGHGSLGAVLPAEPAAHQIGVRVALPDGSLMLACPLRPPGAHAWLTVRVPTAVAAELDALESAMLAVAPAVEHRLVLGRMVLERNARRRASALGEVLERPATSGTRRRALELGWELDGWHTGIRVTTTGELDLTGRRADVAVAFEAEQLRPVVVERGEGWSLWTTANHEPTAVEVQATAAAIRRAHRRLQAAFDVRVGVGRPHPGPEGVRRSLAEAEDAARLAEGRPEAGHFVHVDRLGLAQLLLAWTRTDTFQPAAQSLLAPLADASGELLATLSAFLDAESSVTETAAVLGVHRNTVTARIARIESTLGVDLSVPDDRLALHLACRTALRAAEGH